MSTSQTMFFFDLTLVGCGTALLVVLYRLWSKPRTLPLPPGPKPLPLIGNLLNMPSGDVLEGKHWAKHRALYGPISSVSSLGTTIVIINDSNVAFELLEKRSSIYSNRPTLTFAGEMVGLGAITTLSPYGESLRLHRKWMQNFMGTRAAVRRFEEVEEVETRRLLLRILDRPDKFMDHIRIFPGSVILKICYGYTSQPDGIDYLIGLIDEVVKTIFSESAQPGRWLVDIIPALKYLPEWLPGAGFKKTARKWNKTLQETVDKPYNFVKLQMASGNALPSFVGDVLEKGVANKDDEEKLKYAAATLYGGGADTTVSSILTFCLAMILYPDVFKRAQEEIDRVVGNSCLPGFSNRDNLPYVNALVKETIRWESSIPTAVPHATVEDDTYMGYHIPKGAIVIPNVWQMTHDPETYRDPFDFKPERFLGENGNAVELDPRLLAFGFGRRICPGKEVAENTIFIAIAMLVAVFDISKAKDELGREIEPVNEYTSGLVSHPKPFGCSFTPRSKKSEAMIRTVLEEHPFEKGDVDVLKRL